MPAAKGRRCAGLAGKAGLALGRDQFGASGLPNGLPPALKARLLSLAQDVFVNGYVAALRPTMAVAIGVLLAAAALTPSVGRVERQRVPSTDWETGSPEAIAS